MAEQTQQRITLRENVIEVAETIWVALQWVLLGFKWLVISVVFLAWTGLWLNVARLNYVNSNLVGAVITIAVIIVPTAAALWQTVDAGP